MIMHMNLAVILMILSQPCIKIMADIPIYQYRKSVKQNTGNVLSYLIDGYVIKRGWETENQTMS